MHRPLHSFKQGQGSAYRGELVSPLTPPAVIKRVWIYAAVLPQPPSAPLPILQRAEPAANPPAWGAGNALELYNPIREFISVPRWLSLWVFKLAIFSPGRLIFPSASGGLKQRTASFCLNRRQRARWPRALRISSFGYLPLKWTRMMEVWWGLWAGGSRTDTPAASKGRAYLSLKNMLHLIWILSFFWCTRTSTKAVIYNYELRTCLDKNVLPVLSITHH